jgi:hypothetical protein
MNCEWKELIVILGVRMEYDFELGWRVPIRNVGQTESHSQNFFHVSLTKRRHFYNQWSLQRISMDSSNWKRLFYGYNQTTDKTKQRQIVQKIKNSSCNFYCQIESMTRNVHFRLVGCVQWIWLRLQWMANLS